MLNKNKLYGAHVKPNNATRLFIFICNEAWFCCLDFTQATDPTRTDYTSVGRCMCINMCLCVGVYGRDRVCCTDSTIVTAQAMSLNWIQFNQTELHGAKSDTGAYTQHIRSSTESTKRVLCAWMANDTMNTIRSIVYHCVARKHSPCGKQTRQQTHTHTHARAGYSQAFKCASCRRRATAAITKTTIVAAVSVHVYMRVKHLYKTKTVLLAATHDVAAVQCDLWIRNRSNRLLHQWTNMKLSHWSMFTLCE